MKSKSQADELYEHLLSWGGDDFTGNEIKDRLSKEYLSRDPPDSRRANVCWHRYLTDLARERRITRLPPRLCRVSGKLCASFKLEDGGNSEERDGEQGCGMVSRTKRSRDECLKDEIRVRLDELVDRQVTGLPNDEKKRLRMRWGRDLTELFTNMLHGNQAAVERFERERGFDAKTAEMAARTRYEAGLRYFGVRVPSNPKEFAPDTWRPKFKEILRRGHPDRNNGESGSEFMDAKRHAENIVAYVDQYRPKRDRKGKSHALEDRS